LEQTKIEVLNKVRSAFLAGQAGASIVLAAEKLFESTSLNADAMQQGFNLGAVTSVDLLNAVRDKFQSERDLQRARYEQIKTFLTLKKESGLLTTLDLDEVNSWLSPSAAN
jgi:outer membrane protein